MPKQLKPVYRIEEKIGQLGENMFIRCVCQMYVLQRSNKQDDMQTETKNKSNENVVGWAKQSKLLGKIGYTISKCPLIYVDILITAQ